MGEHQSLIRDIFQRSKNIYEINIQELAMDLRIAFKEKLDQKSYFASTGIFIQLYTLVVATFNTIDKNPEE